MTHYVYLLRCGDKSLYVGETSDLQTRERDHNEGRGGGYTAKRRPVQIVYAEQYTSRDEALKRERQIKRWSLQKKEMLARAGPANKITATPCLPILALDRRRYALGLRERVPLSALPLIKSVALIDTSASVESSPVPTSVPPV